MAVRIEAIQEALQRLSEVDVSLLPETAPAGQRHADNGYASAHAGSLQPRPAVSTHSHVSASTGASLRIRIGAASVDSVNVVEDEADVRVGANRRASRVSSIASDAGSHADSLMSQSSRIAEGRVIASVPSIAASASELERSVADTFDHAIARVRNAGASLRRPQVPAVAEGTVSRSAPLSDLPHTRVDVHRLAAYMAPSVTAGREASPSHSRARTSAVGQLVHAVGSPTAVPTPVLAEPAPTHTHTHTHEGRPAATDPRATTRPVQSTDPMALQPIFHASTSSAPASSRVVHAEAARALTHARTCVVRALSAAAATRREETHDEELSLRTSTPDDTTLPPSRSQRSLAPSQPVSSAALTHTHAPRPLEAADAEPVHAASTLQYETRYHATEAAAPPGLASAHSSAATSPADASFLSSRSAADHDVSISSQAMERLRELRLAVQAAVGSTLFHADVPASTQSISAIQSAPATVPVADASPQPVAVATSGLAPSVGHVTPSNVHDAIRACVDMLPKLDSERLLPRDASFIDSVAVGARSLAPTDTLHSSALPSFENESLRMVVSSLLGRVSQADSDIERMYTRLEIERQYAVERARRDTARSVVSHIKQAFQQVHTNVDVTLSPIVEDETAQLCTMLKASQEQALRATAEAHRLLMQRDLLARQLLDSNMSSSEGLETQSAARESVPPHQHVLRTPVTMPDSDLKSSVFLKPTGFSPSKPAGATRSPTSGGHTSTRNNVMNGTSGAARRATARTQPRALPSSPQPRREAFTRPTLDAELKRLGVH